MPLGTETFNRVIYTPKIYSPLVCQILSKQISPSVTANPSKINPFTPLITKQNDSSRKTFFSKISKFESDSNNNPGKNFNFNNALLISGAILFSLTQEAKTEGAKEAEPLRRRELLNLPKEGIKVENFSNFSEVLQIIKMLEAMEDGDQKEAALLNLARDCIESASFWCASYALEAMKDSPQKEDGLLNLAKDCIKLGLYPCAKYALRAMKDSPQKEGALLDCSRKHIQATESLGIFDFIEPKENAPCYTRNDSNYQGKNIQEGYFDQASNTVISSIALKIQTAAAQNTIDSEFFRSLLKTLGEERGRIAEEQRSDNQSVFGKERKSYCNVTHLEADVYREYGSRFLFCLQKLQEKNDPIVVKGETSGYTSTMTFSKPNRTHLSAWWAPLFYPSTFLCTFNLINKLYKERAIESKEFTYGKIELQKDGISYPLSEYFIFQGEKNFIAHTHQNPIFTEKTMKELENCFIQCISVKNELELKKNVGLLRFLLAHMAPWIRGSAAIAEWLEKAIYQYHGHEKFSYGGKISSKNHYPLADLDALIAFSLEEFLEKYCDYIQLTKSIDPSS